MNSLNLTVPDIINYKRIILFISVGGNLVQQVYCSRVRNIVVVGCEDLNSVTYTQIDFSIGRLTNIYSGSSDNYLKEIWTY